MNRRAIFVALGWSLVTAAMVVFALVVCWQYHGPWPYMTAVLFAGATFRRSLQAQRAKAAAADLK